jgi:hypothetical protein
MFSTLQETDLSGNCQFEVDARSISLAALFALAASLGPSQGTPRRNLAPLYATLGDEKASIDWIVALDKLGRRERRLLLALVKLPQLGHVVRNAAFKRRLGAA